MTQRRASALRPEGRSERLWSVLVRLATSPGRESENPVSWSGMSAPTENLAIEFDDVYTNFVEAFDQLPSESQLLALQAVDTKLAAMIRAQDGALWTIHAHREDPSWNEVRALAEVAIGEFDWPRTLI